MLKTAKVIYIKQKYYSKKKYYLTVWGIWKEAQTHIKPSVTDQNGDLICPRSIRLSTM